MALELTSGTSSTSPRANAGWNYQSLNGITVAARVQFDGVDSGANAILSFIGPSDGRLNFTFTFVTPNPHARIVVDPNDGGAPGNGVADGTGALSTATTYTIVGVANYVGSSVTLYVYDAAGVLLDLVATTGISGWGSQSTATGGGSVTIGDFPAPFNNSSLDGRLQDVQVYYRALSANEVEDLARGFRFGGLYPDHELRLRDETGTPSTLTDTGSAASDPTTENSPTYTTNIFAEHAVLAHLGLHGTARDASTGSGDQTASDTLVMRDEDDRVAWCSVAHVDALSAPPTLNGVSMSLAASHAAGGGIVSIYYMLEADLPAGSATGTAYTVTATADSGELGIACNYAHGRAQEAPEVTAVADGTGASLTAALDGVSEGAVIVAAGYNADDADAADPVGTELELADFSGSATGPRLYCLADYASTADDYTPGWDGFAGADQKIVVAISLAEAGITLSPPAVAGAASILTPTVAPGAVNLAPLAFDAVADFGTPTLTLYFEPSVVDGLEDVQTPEVSLELEPPVVPGTADILTPTVTPGAVELAPPTVDGTAGILTPTVTSGLVLAPPVVDGAAAFPSPTLVLFLLPTAQANSAGILAPTVSLVVFPSSFAGVAGILTPVVADEGSLVLSPPAFAGAAGILAPTVTPGAVDLAPPAVDGVAGVLTPSVGLVLLPSSVAGNAGILTPSLSTVVELLPSAFAGAASILAPSVSSVVELSPAVFAGLLGVPVHRVDLELLAPVVANPAGILLPTIALGSSILSPPSVAGVATILTPTVVVQVIFLPVPPERTGSLRGVLRFGSLLGIRRVGSLRGR